ncbi:TetR/AcrR family transcriptional regulator [Microbacterium lacticum]
MPSNKNGRPFTPGITEALLQAAERVMVDEGYSALTIDALAGEVGTTRPTFYRRFPSIAHLALEVIKNRYGTGSPVDTGSLYEDLLTIQREEIAMFASPLIRNNLLGLLEAARNDSELSARYESCFIRPRRENVARIIRMAIARDELVEEGLDIESICDDLVGPILSRALLPVNAPLDDRLARHTTETALKAMGATTPATT